MYRYLLILTMLILTVAGTAIDAAAARTYVTRRPVYGRNYMKPYNRGFRHNYRHPAYYNNMNGNRRFYNTYPQRRLLRRNNYYTSMADLSALEKYTMNRSYNRDNDIERLERLEMQAFGAIQNGDLNSRYDNVRSAILARPKTNYKTSWLRNIGNYFSGQMTGFTPSLDNDPFFSSSGFTTTPYPTTYGNSNITQFSSPFGNGYHYNNYGTGSSSGVKILD